MDIRFLGHACFELSEGDARVARRPVPEAQQPGLAGDRRRGGGDPHPDHPRPRRPHGRRGRASPSAPAPTAWRSSRSPAGSSDQGVEAVSDPNLGGTVEFDWGWVKLVQAFHTNTIPGSAESPFSAEAGVVIGTAAGLVINIGGTTVYHLGDTCLFGDMKLIAERTPVDVALIPIGGHYTMDRHDAAVAAGLIGARNGDPDPLQHLPADRGRRRGVQVGRRVEDRLARSWCSSPATLTASSRAMRAAARRRTETRRSGRSSRGPSAPGRPRPEAPR